MKTEEVAPGVVRLSLWPLDLLNVYLLEDVLVDSGTSAGCRRLLSALSARPLSGHVVTHAHPDHQGCSHAVCDRFAIPLWCGEGDQEALESGDLARLLSDPTSLFARTSRRFAGPGHPVARALIEGDEVAGFTIVEAPGHTPGHIALWRASDRVLVLGDVVFHRNPVTARRGLTEPFRLATHDVSQNRESARKLAALEPATVCFGHGAPLRDPEAFQRYVSALPVG